MAWQFNSYAQTDLGLVRQGNEDAALTSSNLIAVADGMGGHAGGEVASAIAINTLAKIISLLESNEIDADFISIPCIYNLPPSFNLLLSLVSIWYTESLCI